MHNRHVGSPSPTISGRTSWPIQRFMDELPYTIAYVQLARGIRVTAMGPTSRSPWPSVRPAHHGGGDE